MTFINAYKVETKNMLHSSLKVLGNMFKPVPAITVDQSEITPTATVSFNKDNRTLTWTLTGINVTSHILRLYEDSIQVISQPVVMF